jgi:urease accessory protein UreF
MHKQFWEEEMKMLMKKWRDVQIQSGVQFKNHCEASVYIPESSEGHKIREGWVLMGMGLYKNAHELCWWECCGQSEEECIHSIQWGQTFSWVNVTLKFQYIHRWESMRIFASVAGGHGNGDIWCNFLERVNPVI